MPKFRKIIYFFGILITISATVKLISHNPRKLKYKRGYFQEKNKIREFNDGLQEEKKTDFKEMFEHRMLHLRSACNSTHQTRRFEDLTRKRRDILLKHIIVSDKYKFLYCYTPKVGCSNWKKVIKFLHGVAPAIEVRVMDHIHGLNFLNNYTPEEIEFRFREYYKFTFVRHPFDRLLSAYKNKFGEIPFYMKRYGTEIINKHRWQNNNTDETFKGKIPGDDVTFTEFIQYITSPTVTQESMNEHWMSLTTLCQPCVVNYDFVGTYDNLLEESNKVLRKVGAPSNVKFPNKQGFYHETGVSVLAYFYSLLPSKLCKSLAQKYDSDFYFFSFDIPRLNVLE